jgi:MoaA/NifB/PqqE/SkfB family radical SAM enzyme
MHIQIEITTRCNYQCFYCAGRDMPQTHMAWLLFNTILHNLPAGRHRISLQGEGEPFWHPRFWDMVDRIVQCGHTPHTITNGSHLDVERIAQYFPKIGISIDTIDPGEANRIKRYNVRNVLHNLHRLLQVYPPERILIHTVDYGQDLQPLAVYLRSLGITKHIVQPLQEKDDYAYRYSDLLPQRAPGHYTYHCRYITAPLMRYYNVDGIEMPCCFIKDVSQFLSTDHIRRDLEAGTVPATCRGCREIYTTEP